jgi:hypothetical protein
MTHPTSPYPDGRAEPHPPPLTLTAIRRTTAPPDH